MYTVDHPLRKDVEWRHLRHSELCVYGRDKYVNNNVNIVTARCSTDRLLLRLIRLATSYFHQISPPQQLQPQLYFPSFSGLLQDLSALWSWQSLSSSDVIKVKAQLKAICVRLWVIDCDAWLLSPCVFSQLPLPEVFSSRSSKANLTLRSQVEVNKSGGKA